MWKEFACPNPGNCLVETYLTAWTWSEDDDDELGRTRAKTWSRTGPFLQHDGPFFHRPAHTHTHALGGLGNSVFGNVYLMICAFASLYRSRGPSSRISHLQQQQQKQQPGGRARVQFWSTWFLSLSLPLSRFWFPL